MFLLPFLIGMVPLVLVGWLAVRALEGTSKLLTNPERFVYGAILGPTLVMEVVFLLNAAHILGVNLLGYLIGILLLLIPLGILKWKRRQASASSESSASFTSLSARPSKSTIVILSLLGLWLLLKFIAGMMLLMSDPAYNDDVFNNWHYRSKILHHEEMLVLEFPGAAEGDGPGVHAYPPTVPLVKVWFAVVNGGWNDHLAALTSPLWYLLALALVFVTLRRYLGFPWGIVGTYLLGSLPLVLIHGSTPYADLFVALHIGVALLPLYVALQSESAEARSAWLRLSALGTALLPMTKNEALLMHLPPILIIAAGVIAWSAYTQKFSRKEAAAAALWFVGLVGLVLMPWLLYKWANGLTFGNAKGIAGLEIVWQPNVLRSLFITLVLEANFLLLPGLLLALLIVRWRLAFRSPTLVLTAFSLVTIFGIIGIFLFTGLSAEALRQTGSARGIVQLLPVITVLVTILLADLYRGFVVRK